MSLIALLFIFLISIFPAQSQIYLSPDSGDTFKTAIEKTRTPGAKKEIILSEGNYYNFHTDITQADSGLTIKAASGKKPVLYGGRTIKGWQKDGDFYSAKLDGVKERTWDFRALIVNNNMRPRARYPKEGSLKHLTEFNVRWMSSIGNGWERKPTEEELTTMKYIKGDLGPWLDVNNAEITIYHSWDESVVGLKSLDDNTQIVRFSIPSGHPPGAFGNWIEKAKTYVVWNIREGMTEPGQWYLDRTNGKVVYWPLPGEDMSKVEVIAPTTETIFSLEKGVSDITIDGLTLSCTTTPLITGGFGAGNFKGAVDCQTAKNCVFNNLTVESVGGWAFTVRGQNNKITNCEIVNIGAGAVRHSGSNLEIFNNHIHDIGIIYPSAIGILGGGRGLKIIHNEIHGTPYSGIHCSSANALIENNLFYDTMKILSDGAAIYIGFAKGMIVRGNIVRGSRGAGPAHAYYMDEKSDSCVVENNLAIDTAWPAHNHMTVNCFIRNNVFIDKGDQRLTFPRSMGMTFEKNILIADEITFQFPTGKEKLPDSAGDVPDAVKPFLKADGITSMPNNLIFSRKGKINFDVLADYNTVRTVSLEARDGTVFADPMLNNIEKGDYKFKSGSPAIKLGIVPIDISKAGLIKKKEVK